MNVKKISALLVAVLAITAAACSGKKTSTPTQAFTAFYEAAKAKDAAGLKRTLAKESLTRMEEKKSRLPSTLDEVLINETQSGIPDKLPETRNEKIDGDKATLEFNYKRGETDNWRTISFVREDGEWKVIFK